MGLGKTIRALSVIEMAVREREKLMSVADGGKGKMPAVVFKPTLVVFPHAATGVWKKVMRAQIISN